MQSHIWDRIVATIVKQKLFLIHLRLSLLYLSLSSLHFFILSSLFSLCALLMWFTDLPMIVLRRWSWVVGRGLSSGNFVGLGLWVWVHRSVFVGLGSWVCVCGSAFVDHRCDQGWDWGGGFWLGLRSGWWVLVGVKNKMGGWWLRWVVVAKVWVLGLMGLLAVAAVGLGFVGFFHRSILHLPLFLSRWGFSLPSFFFLAMGLIFGWMLVVVAMGWPWVWVCYWMLLVYGGGGEQWLAIEKKMVERERKR